MVTPGPVSPLQSPSFVRSLLQSHPCCPAPYYKCQRILIWLRVTKSSLRQCLCTTVIKEKVLTFIHSVARHCQYFISNCKFPTEFLLVFYGLYQLPAKTPWQHRSCKHTARFWANLINAAPLMNALVSFRNKLLKQLKYSCEPFRLWLV